VRRAVQRGDARLLFGEQRGGGGYVVPRLGKLRLDAAQPRVGLADPPGDVGADVARIGQHLRTESTRPSASRIMAMALSVAATAAVK